jgi:chromosome segregation ATPase
MGLGNEGQFLGGNSDSEYQRQKDEKRRLDKERANALLLKSEIKKTENTLRHKESELKRIHIKQRELQARSSKLSYDIPKEDKEIIKMEREVKDHLDKVKDYESRVKNEFRLMRALKDKISKAKQKLLSSRNISKATTRQVGFFDKDIAKLEKEVEGLQKKLKDLESKTK